MAPSDDDGGTFCFLWWKIDYIFPLLLLLTGGGRHAMWSIKQINNIFTALDVLMKNNASLENFLKVAPSWKEQHHLWHMFIITRNMWTLLSFLMPDIYICWGRRKVSNDGSHPYIVFLQEERVFHHRVGRKEEENSIPFRESRVNWYWWLINWDGLSCAPPGVPKMCLSDGGHSFSSSQQTKDQQQQSLFLFFSYIIHIRPLLYFLASPQRDLRAFHILFSIVSRGELWQVHGPYRGIISFQLFVYRIRCAFLVPLIRGFQ